MIRGTRTIPSRPPPGQEGDDAIDTPTTRRSWIRLAETMVAPRFSVRLGPVLGAVGAALLAFPGRITATPADLLAAVEAFQASPRGQGVRVGLEFVPLEVGDRTPSAAYSAETPLIPASVTKIVTALAALETFGPTHTFTTEILRSGPIVDGVLDGDLGFHGNGDPYLVSERVWLLAHEIRAAGLRRVTGDLVVYVGDFALDDPTAAASLGTTDRSYAARPSVLAINFNCVAVRVAPGTTAGSAPRVAGEPYDLGYLGIDADGLRTGAAGSPGDWSLTVESTPHGLRYEDWMQAVGIPATRSGTETPARGGMGEASPEGRPETAPPHDLPGFVLPEGPLEIARVRGVVPLGAESQVAYRRARYPLPMVATYLRAALADFGIEIAGAVRIEARPPASRSWLEFPSLPLADLVESMNRYSSNFIANQLALSVHAERQARVGVQSGQVNPESPSLAAVVSRSSAAEGGDTALPSRRPLLLAEAGASLTAWLAEAAPGSAGECRLFDGSGLSADGRLTARALTAILVRAWDDLRLQPKLLASLPGPGEPGTLRSRFRRGAAPVIWAKTGTLADTRVSSLAGYFEDSGGRTVAFSILINATGGSSLDVGSMQALQEEWVSAYLR